MNAGRSSVTVVNIHGQSVTSSTGRACRRQRRTRNIALRVEQRQQTTGDVRRFIG